jgi:U3 small nucleolar RNA-associated protein 23
VRIHPVAFDLIISLVITQCCIEGLYREGPSQQGAVEIAKLFERRKCNHKETIDGDECLRSIVGEDVFHRTLTVTHTLSNVYRLQERIINTVMWSQLSHEQ